jgi:hypothetical protein
MRNALLLFLGILNLLVLGAQEMPLEYRFGEKYNDRYRYSNLLTFAETHSGDKLLVRAYYQGLILRPKGYLIERYSPELELLDEFNYKLKGKDFVDGFVANGQIYLLFLSYDPEKFQYDYTIHQSPVGNYNFRKKTLLSIPSDYVDSPLDKNYYNRKFRSGFSTTVHFNKARTAFAISLHHKKGKDNKHRILVYNNNLDKLFDIDFSAEVEEKNYAFEEMETSPDLSRVYLMGKAYFKKRRFKADERKFQYELLALSGGGSQTQTFDQPGKYSEALKPLWHKNKLICVGFYADRKDNRYNGLEYFELDPVSLNIEKSTFNSFTEQFMFDKFGKSDDKIIKNLVFKDVRFTDTGDLLFNAEEYFVTESMQTNASGGRVKIERFHHNDIVSVKLNSQGRLEWARNINKTEVTQGDGAYASYSAYTKNGHTYFFICTAAENPQLLNKERLIFKQGLSRNRNVFAIELDPQGKMSYEKIIDQQEARLPLMVSKPLVDTAEETLYFYAKRGSKKQLVAVAVK